MGPFWKTSKLWGNEVVAEILDLCGFHMDVVGKNFEHDFEVGQNGQNLRMSDRSALALARGLLADPQLLLVHMPGVFQPPAKRQERTYRVLKAFTENGGLLGVIEELKPEIFKRMLATHPEYKISMQQKRGAVLVTVEGTFIDDYVVMDLEKTPVCVSDSTDGKARIQSANI